MKSLLLTLSMTLIVGCSYAVNFVLPLPQSTAQKKIEIYHSDWIPENNDETSTLRMTVDATLLPPETRGYVFDSHHFGDKSGLFEIVSHIEQDETLSSSSLHILVHDKLPGGGIIIDNADIPLIGNGVIIRTASPNTRFEASVEDAEDLQVIHHNNNSIFLARGEKMKMIFQGLELYFVKQDEQLYLTHVGDTETRKDIPVIHMMQPSQDDDEENNGNREQMIRAIQNMSPQEFTLFQLQQPAEARPVLEAIYQAGLAERAQPSQGHQFTVEELQHALAGLRSAREEDQSSSGFGDDDFDPGNLGGAY